MSQIKQNIIGLAGHIDHGKTSIVKALTGVNTDNLKEEIHRGMTINIGFAFLNDNITLIDVPGHEKFIKNMVVGINAIDYALLVIAADDGIMPQTIEHFEILKLFNIQDGAIIINKIDKVENEWIQLVENEVSDLVKGSFLEGKQIYKTDAISLNGIDVLRKSLINKEYINFKNNNKIFRMFIDRVFISKGFGSIVTGTIISGKIKVGDKVKILPQNKIAKIRGLETHKNKFVELSFGNRAAINLQFNDKINLARGNHLSEIDYFSAHEQVIVSVTILSKLPKGIKNNERLRIYLGTQEVMARIIIYNKKNIDPGQSCGAILKFEKPTVCSINDRFIIRKYSPLVTIGGGQILDFNLFQKWSQNKEYINKIYNSANNVDRLICIIEKQKIKPFTFIKLSKYLNISHEKIIDLVNIDNIKILDNHWLVTNTQFEYILSKIILYFDNYHEKNPYSNGIIKDVILNSLNMEVSFLDFILDYLLQIKKIKCNNAKWFKYNFNINLSEDELAIKNKLINIINEKGFNAISIKDLKIIINQDLELINKMLEIEISNHNIILIDGNLLFSKEKIDKLLNIVKTYFIKNETLDVKNFKELTNTSRKYAVPLLEYLDKINLTYRVGNERKIRKN